MKKTLGILFLLLLDVPLFLLAAFLVVWGIELISNGFCIFR